MNEQKAMQAYKVLRAMDSVTDLKRASFTLSDYRAAQDCLQEYARNNGEDETATISEAVAKWYAKQGFDVQPEGIGWRIR